MSIGFSEVTLSFQVAAGAETVWSLVRRFDKVATWNPFLARSRLLEGAAGKIGAIREVVTTDDVAVREQLEELDESRFVLGYRMLTFPIPVTQQHNRIVLTRSGLDDASLLTFFARFRPIAGTAADDVAAVNRTAFTAAANGVAANLDVKVVLAR